MNTQAAPAVVDLFCGIGGLSHGFALEGFDVKAGYDIDPSCKFAYEENNHAKFNCVDVSDVTGEEIQQWYTPHSTKILVGCAPCQPFSSYNFKNNDEKKWYLLHQFARIIEEIQPDIVSMENVPQLMNFKKANVLDSFIATLEKNKYQVSCGVVDCIKYGLPQKRKRFVLLASKLGKIELLPPTHDNAEYVSVKDAIGFLPAVEHGEQSSEDPLHKASRLSELNLRRIKQSVPGGSWRDWDEDLQLACHQKDSGSSYVSVYGRMKWDEPSPTITTQCYGLGNGRFGHPEQDRALTLREAALLQSFPLSYKFVAHPNALSTRQLGTHIGNAVPVLLGQVIAKSIKLHLQEYEKANEKV